MLHAGYVVPVPISKASTGSPLNIMNIDKLLYVRELKKFEVHLKPVH